MGLERVPSRQTSWANSLRWERAWCVRIEKPSVAGAVGIRDVKIGWLGLRYMQCPFEPQWEFYSMSNKKPLKGSNRGITWSYLLLLKKWSLASRSQLLFNNGGLGWWLRIYILPGAMTQCREPQMITNLLLFTWGLIKEVKDFFYCCCCLWASSIPTPFCFWTSSSVPFHPHIYLPPISSLKRLIWTLPDMAINGPRMKQTCRPSLQATYRVLSSMEQDFPFSNAHSFNWT